MPRQLSLIVVIYVVLLVAILGNIAYFVLTALFMDAGKSTKYGAVIGIVPTLCFGLVAVATAVALVLEQRVKSDDLRYHVSKQVGLILLLVLGGLSSAIQTSARWLVESDSLAALMNLLIICLVIYVLWSLMTGVVGIFILRGKMLETVTEPPPPPAAPGATT